MDVGIVVAALGGLLLGAAAAWWVSMEAPRMYGKVTLFAALAAACLPFLVGIGGKDQVLDSAAKGGIEALQSQMLVSFFVMSIPLGALSIGLSKNAVQRFAALAMMGMFGMPAYFSLTVFIAARSIVSGIA
jgi:hypothetical protein